MKRLAALALLSASVCAHAVTDNGKGIELKPLPGRHALVMTEDREVSGLCGAAVVTISGINLMREDDNPIKDLEFNGNSYTDLQVKIGTKTHSYDILSDYNMVHCVPTAKGPRLLVGSNCGGSLCSDAKDYTIINLSNGHQFPAKNASTACDTECANKALGFKYLKEGMGPR
ncbi:MAG: hypothetical protein PHU14_03860 [Methylovulum sp.]|nr:hypothetical protein [Methylovulum sp.]